MSTKGNPSAFFIWLTYSRHKIDAIQQQMELMRQSIDAVLAEKRQAKTPQEANHLGTSTATPGSTTSLAGLSTREDNMQMAMTRENSLEPPPNSDQANSAVTVEEPMGSLYEVTRLRNIRSNRAKTAREVPGSQGELNDFISRGVISEHEAEELYKL